MIKTELARARAAGEPVIYLTDNHVPDDAEFKVFPPHAIAGTKGAEIIPELAPEDDEDVIPKRRYSGFFGTDLDITLRERESTRCAWWATARTSASCTPPRMRAISVTRSRSCVTASRHSTRRRTRTRSRELEKTLGAKIV